MTPAEVACRARHPSRRSAPDPSTLMARVVDELAAEGHPFPRFVGMVLALRGGAGLDQASFGELVGLPLGLLRALESGVVDPTHAPPRLAHLVATFEESVARRAPPG
jgi:DNA-binding transcriptional regulator YiaG